MFASDLAVWFNLSQLAANIGATRTVIYGLVRDGAIKIDGCTDTGQPLFRASELNTARDIFLRHAGRI